MPIVYLNGIFMERDAARVAPNDRGLLYGDGIFETLIARNGRIFRLDRHLRRMYRSAAELELKMPLEIAEAAGVLEKLVAANDLQDAYLRFMVTRGVSEGMAPADTGEATVFAVATPLRPYPDELYDRGAVVISTPYYLGPLSRHKTLSFLPNVLARMKAKKKGGDEGLIFDRKGDPAECSSSNIFIVVRGVVVTPPASSGILPGITRGEILEICREKSIPAEERGILLDELRSADEMFVTNSIMGVMPVGRLDDVKYRGERAVTSVLASTYLARVRTECGGLGLNGGHGG
jgi:branched-chain amino acid aminotransferase